MRGKMVDDLTKLISDNVGLVYHIVQHDFSNYRLDEDVVQSGMLGLCKAANRYDETKGAFSTYARKFIRGAILREIKGRQDVISLDTLMEKL